MSSQPSLPMPDRIEQAPRAAYPLGALSHTAKECSAAFEWLRALSINADSPPEAGIAFDEWARLVRLTLESSAHPATDLANAAQDVLAERARQIASEGWTLEHDDEHDPGDLACAGAAYALSAGDAIHPMSQGDGGCQQPTFWPWDAEWWKPKTPRQDLVRAAALIIAEIERLDRAEHKLKAAA